MDSRPFRVIRQRLPVDHGHIVAEAFVPEGHRPHWLVFSHPHPLYGGSMYQPVVVRVCRIAAQSGIPSLRFNFRGVGGSTGSFSGGIGETQDFHQAVRYLESVMHPTGLIVGGYSFGAWISYQWSDRNPEKTMGWLGLAPPVDILPFHRPVHEIFRTVIAGDHDPFASTDRLGALATAPKALTRLTLIQGADHFFRERLNNLDKAVSAFFMNLYRAHQTAEAPP